MSTEDGNSKESKTNATDTLSPQPQSVPEPNSTKTEEMRLTLSSTIEPITDSDFENVHISLHSAVLIFNQLLAKEDTSQWYFLEKVHKNYFKSKQKWTDYLSKVSPNAPIDFHDIRKQIINGYYNKSDSKTLLTDIGSVFTNAMIRYDSDSDSDSDTDTNGTNNGEQSENDNHSLYDESQRLLTKYQTLCSEMESVESTEELKTDEISTKEDIIIVPSPKDVFEIEDYYCASPWERLISAIEKQLQAWNLHNGSTHCAVEYKQQMRNGCVLSTHISVNNSDYNYSLEYHDYSDFIGEELTHKTTLSNPYYTLSMHEMVTREREPTLIGNNTHEICLWFGVSRFILLLPDSGSDSGDYINESECLFMFSTLCIACFNTQCALSYYVPFGDEWDMSFKGGLKYNRYSIEYVCKSQRNIPQMCQYLDGIFKVFKRHLRLYYDESDPMLQMSTSIHNALYRIYGNVSYKYVYDPSTNILALLNHNWRDFMADDKISYGIRWGPTYSPLRSLSLSTIWTYFPEGAFIDNIAHSDLDPYNAPKWILNAVWSELSTKKLQSESHTPLTNALYNLLIIARDLVEDADIVWRDIISSNAIKQRDIKQVMIEKRQLSDSGQSSAMENGKLMSPNDSKHPLFEDFIKQNVLKHDLYIEGEEIETKDNTDTEEEECEYFKKSKMLKSPSPPISQPKCAPFGSLLSIFVLRLFEIEDIDIGHIGDVWYKLTYAVSNRWTDCQPLPGLYGLPDFRTCLLHQKLQLLNECIRRKTQQREYIQFKGLKLSRKKSADLVEMDALPCGVEKKHPFLHLLKRAISLNIPVTQDHPIFTADKLEAHYEELVSLGSSLDASKKRAELQSKQLKSDMMAFKAANPNCILEDFIRWYSPNDWVVSEASNNDSNDEEIIFLDSNDSDSDNHSFSDDIISSSDGSSPKIMTKPAKKKKSKQNLLQKSGQLSQRMRAKGNIWSRIWDESEAIPAMEQELLFDFDIEGNEALKWIMNLQPTDTLLQICQIGIGNCVSIFQRTPGIDRQLSPLIAMIQSLTKSTKQIWKVNKETNENYLDLEMAISAWVKEVRLAEMGCACGAALTFTFDSKDCRAMIEKLMTVPYQSQIASLREKEAVLAVIGQRIYDDYGGDDNESDSDEAYEGKESNTGFWSWGSPKDGKDKKARNYDASERKDSIVIYDNEAEEETSKPKKIRRGRRYELPKPSSKQYTVLASAPRPHPDSQSTPNRMHVTIDKFGFKMALATATIE